MASRDSDRPLLAALTAAETAARLASHSLLHGLPTVSSGLRDRVEPLIAYTSTCRDPFPALEIARLLRAILEDMQGAVYARGSITEWAHVELRIAALTSRISRTLRDERQWKAEQSLVDLAVLHLRALEESPQYAEILEEMTRIQNSGQGVRHTAPTEEFFGLARGDVILPTQEPEEEG